MDTAIELAKQRWAALLNAIKYMSRIRSYVPATRYQLFENELQRIASKQIFEQLFS